MIDKEELKRLLGRELTTREIHVHNVMSKDTNRTCKVENNKIVYNIKFDGYGR